MPSIRVQPLDDDGRPKGPSKEVEVTSFSVTRSEPPALCAPLTPYYDLQGLNAITRPVSASLPTFSLHGSWAYPLMSQAAPENTVVDPEEVFPPGNSGMAEVCDDEGFLLKPGTPEHSAKAARWVRERSAWRQASGMMERQTEVMKAQARASMTPMTEEEVETATLLHDLEPWGERVGPHYFEVFHNVKAQMEELSVAWENMTRGLMNSLPMFSAPSGGITFYEDPPLGVVSPTESNRAERRGQTKAKRLCPIHGLDKATCKICRRNR